MDDDNGWGRRADGREPGVGFEGGLTIKGSPPRSLVLGIVPAGAGWV
jgi:hypothetical protein